MSEVWKSITNFPNYKVSNLGRVKSIDRFVIDKNGLTKFHKGRLLSLRNNPSGYKFVSLWKDNIEHSITVHRLVAQVFIPNPNNYPFINHKNKDRHCNNVDNLEWCTQEYNNVHGKGSKIRCFHLSSKFTKDYNSIHEASRDLDIPYTTIAYNISGKTSRAGSYKFEKL